MILSKGEMLPVPGLGHIAQFANAFSLIRLTLPRIGWLKNPLYFVYIKRVHFCKKLKKGGSFWFFSSLREETATEKPGTESSPLARRMLWMVTLAPRGHGGIFHWLFMRSFFWEILNPGKKERHPFRPAAHPLRVTSSRALPQSRLWAAP